MWRESARDWLARPWPQVGLSILRACLIMAWLLWAAMAWWSAPRPVDIDQAQRDIAAGQVSSFCRAETWDHSRQFWGATPSPNVKHGNRVYWFWVSMIPFGLGVVAWLAMERPWSRSAQALFTQRLGDFPPRRTGWTGFGHSFSSLS